MDLTDDTDGAGPSAVSAAAASASAALLARKVELEAKLQSLQKELDEVSVYSRSARSVQAAGKPAGSRAARR